jgi:hypothetical protein
MCEEECRAYLAADVEGPWRCCRDDEDGLLFYRPICAAGQDFGEG